MTRVFLFLNTVLFLGFGAYAFLNPEILAAIYSADGVSTDGTYEIRSNYGGVSIGAGLLCLAGAVRESLARPALFFLVAYTGGYALGRILALPLDGTPSPNLIGYALFEAVTATLAFALLRRG